MFVKGAKFPKWGPNSLGNMAPGGPNFLGNLARGGQIFGGAKFPVTPERISRYDCFTFALQLRNQAKHKINGVVLLEVRLMESKVMQPSKSIYGQSTLYLLSKLVVARHYVLYERSSLQRISYLICNETDRTINPHNKG